MAKRNRNVNTFHIPMRFSTDLAIRNVICRYKRYEPPINDEPNPDRFVLAYISDRRLFIAFRSGGCGFRGCEVSAGQFRKGLYGGATFEGCSEDLQPHSSRRSRLHDRPE